MLGWTTTSSATRPNTAPPPVYPLPLAVVVLRLDRAS